VGKDAVREAVVAAAYALFQEQSPSTVSLRAIAARAGVNYGLIHRYFGTKEAVLGAVFEHQSAIGREIVRSTSNARDALRALYDHHPEAGYARMVAWAILDDADLSRFVSPSPALGAVLDLLEDRSQHDTVNDVDDVDAKVAVALSVMLILGWEFFEPYLVRLVGLDIDTEFLHDKIGGLILRVFDLVRPDDLAPLSRA
jgi:AcrR family transcriptional regulator